MMRQLISRFVGKEVAKRWSLLRTAALITLRPSAFSERIATEEADVVLPSSRFFLMAVGIVLANEALFSVAFETAFSDLVHHSFPVFVALTGGVAQYLILFDFKAAFYSRCPLQPYGSEHALRWRRRSHFHVHGDLRIACGRFLAELWKRDGQRLQFV
jgi:hypothetical protein